MQRVAMMARLKPERIEEYKENHKHVWRGVLEAIDEAGMRNYSIFLRGNELFLYFEAEDGEEALKKVWEFPEVRRWNEISLQMFESMDEKGTIFVPMESVFYHPGKK